MTSSSRSKNSEQSAKESLYYNILQCFHTSDSIKVSDLFLLKKSLAEELQNIDGQDLLDTFVCTVYCMYAFIDTNVSCFFIMFQIE